MVVDPDVAHDPVDPIQPAADGAFVPADDDAVGTDLTRAGGILGTPAYMAPEQHLALDADARADQFAFVSRCTRVCTASGRFGGATRSS